MLEACRTHGTARLVHTSTSETYGTALYTPIDEKHPLQSQSSYAASKTAADKLAESYHLSFGLPVVTIRPFNAYGPRQSARAVIPTIIAQALASRVIRLGSVAPVRDLTFVLDTVAGFVAVAEADGAVGEVVNVGRGIAVTVGDLASLIQRTMGTSKEIVVDEARVRPDSLTPRPFRSRSCL